LKSAFAKEKGITKPEITKNRKIPLTPKFARSEVRLLEANKSPRKSSYPIK